MYKRAYGGAGRVGAFEPSPAEDEEAREREEALMARRMVKIGTPPPGRATPVARKAAAAAAAMSPTEPVAAMPVLKISTANLASGGPVMPIIVRPKAVSPEPHVADQQQQHHHHHQPQIPSPRRLNVKAPKLTLQTAPTTIEVKIEKAPSSRDVAKDEDEDEDDESEHGDRTARPFHGMPFWSNIDELLSPVDGPNSKGGGGGIGDRRKSEKLGPMTPNGYDDISPITRGEWGFLFSRDGSWDDKRTAPVETW
ncbi:hypothetical protein Micbo1qcDRAFT_156496 [Microdochium bolleyi]|uniref:Uncharacterized protein n=1 Tax=Microdochium bolleyi TaxID=196109 RepID=A0A136JK80_9PEZI|nr:hypothetical protein Micbo1qcDRAFT_156496 [Microdochium bolleyi]